MQVYEIEERVDGLYELVRTLSRQVSESYGAGPAQHTSFKQLFLLQFLFQQFHLRPFNFFFRKVTRKARIWSGPWLWE